MGTGVPALPPEHLWPTGDMPPELVSAARAEGVVLGSQQVVPSGIAVPPREFDPAALEAERPPEGDALLQNLRSVLNKGRNGGVRPAPMPPAPPNYATADMHYSFPLSATGARAEVNLYGEIGAKDIELLCRYLKLTAKGMRDGEAASARLSEHVSDGPDAKLPERRGRVRSGTGR